MQDMRVFIPIGKVDEAAGTVYGNRNWISAGAILSVQQGDVESLVADDIVRFGKPLADRLASAPSARSQRRRTIATI
jgi:hypothetical protein